MLSSPQATMKRFSTHSQELVIERSQSQTPRKKQCNATKQEEGWVWGRFEQSARSDKRLCSLSLEGSKGFCNGIPWGDVNYNCRVHRPVALSNKRSNVSNKPSSQLLHSHLTQCSLRCQAAVRWWSPLHRAERYIGSHGYALSCRHPDTPLACRLEQVSMALTGIEHIVKQPGVAIVFTTV